MSIHPLAPLPNALKECLVTDAQAGSHKIGDLLEDRATLLLFVRHFGCIGCSENIGLMAPRFNELQELGVRILIIGCGAPNFIEGFMERHQLLFGPAEVFSDESLSSHQAADLLYSLWGGFRPRALYEMTRAFVAGNVSTGNQGDIKQQAGAILVDSKGMVRLYHQNESLGDHVDPSKVVESAMTALISSNPEAE
jgi:peroxiredoxin